MSSPNGTANAPGAGKPEMTGQIDLNADIGEGDTEEDMLRDEALMAVVSSVNIACGGHAGSSQSIARMIASARQHDCAIGAHPSYPDRKGFGRKSMDIEPDALADSLVAQIRAVSEEAQRQGTLMAHIKPHGALYNHMADDPELANQLASRFARHWPETAQMGLAGGAATAAAQAAGVRYIAEGFIDRRYDARGRLVTRGLPGAMIEDDVAREHQALAIAASRPVKDVNGRDIIVRADSLCIHSDSPGAVNTARRLAEALESAGFVITAPAS